MSDMSLHCQVSSKPQRVSIQLMALFISSWRCRTSSGNVLRRVLGEAHKCGALEILVSSGAPGREEVEGECLVWAMSLAIPDCDDPCWEGGISFREAGSIFPPPRGFPPHWLLEQLGP